MSQGGLLTAGPLGAKHAARRSAVVPLVAAEAAACEAWTVGDLKIPPLHDELRLCKGRP